MLQKLLQRQYSPPNKRLKATVEFLFVHAPGQYVSSNALECLLRAMQNKSKAGSEAAAAGAAERHTQITEYFRHAYMQVRLEEILRPPQFRQHFDM